jgi:Ca2+-binding EF-hand superfamily protein
MINEATGPINFTMFLTMFGDKLNGTDPESVILNAFACFDENTCGNISDDKLRDLLISIGDRFNDDECDELFRDAPINNNLFDYIEFTRILKHGRREDDSSQTL